MIPRVRACGRPTFASLVGLASLLAVLPQTASAQVSAATAPAGFVDELIASGLGLPVGIAFLPDGRLLAVEQKSAHIDLVRMGPPATVDSVGFVPSVNIIGTERGLLGIAVDPEWPVRPYVYTHSTDVSSNVRISRFKAAGALTDPAGLIGIDPASRYDLVNDIPDNADNHNGGTVRFGTDGMLYVSLGEDAFPSAAQDTSTLRGVILRLDVSRLPDGPGSAARALVTPPGNPFGSTGGLNARLLWEYGLRNPFRLQVDPMTGTLLIADVGESTWEEVDLAPVGGLDFGWPHYEGDMVYSSVALTGSPTFPIYVINHTTGAKAVISAGIYRHPAGGTRAFPAEYEGDAFISDYYAGFMRRLHQTGVAWDLAAPVTGQPSSTDWAQGLVNVSDYAIGPEGGIWYCREYVTDFAHSGQIRRIVSTASSSVDNASHPVAFARPYPLPSTGSVQFDWSIAHAARVSLAILDVRGRLVRAVAVPRALPVGHHHAIWDGLDSYGRAVQPGIYFARLEVDGTSLEQRVLIVR